MAILVETPQRRLLYDTGPSLGPDHDVGARTIVPYLRSRGIRHLKVVFSPEQPAATTQLEAPSPGRRSVPASVPWVPSTAGILLAGAIVRDLIG